jgi:uncharacterized protein (DUF1800 family)
MKTRRTITLSLLLFACIACNKETYRTSKEHQMTEKAKKSHHFLAKQAHVLTSENLESRDKNVKKATKKNAKQQEELNAANAKISKTAKKKKFTGEFNFY